MAALDEWTHGGAGSHDEQVTMAFDEPAVGRNLARRGLRERHLDLLLAEELAVNPRFARWVAEGALRDVTDGPREALPLPEGPPSSVSTKVSYWDPVGHPNAAGETDVLVRLEWQAGWPVGLFVEDKLDAVFQPWQAERYAARAAVAEIPTATVLVAPRDFIDGHRASVLFGKAIAMEDIAEWLRVEAATADTWLAARLRWRAGALDVLASQRPPAIDDPQAVRFTALFADTIEVLGCIVDRRSCHTANQGWIWFTKPSALGYKATHGLVDLYVKDIGVDVGRDAVARCLAGRLPVGFEVAQDTVPNTVLRARMPRRLNPADAYTSAEEIADPETFDAAVGSCREAVLWLDAGGAELLRSLVA